MASSNYRCDQDVVEYIEQFCKSRNYTVKVNLELFNRHWKIDFNDGWKTIRTSPDYNDLLNIDKLCNFLEGVEMQFKELWKKGNFNGVKK